MSHPLFGNKSWSRKNKRKPDKTTPTKRVAFAADVTEIPTTPAKRVGFAPCRVPSLSQARDLDIVRCVPGDGALELNAFKF
jgi:hypothetical protein